MSRKFKRNLVSAVLVAGFAAGLAAPASAAGYQAAQSKDPVIIGVINQDGGSSPRPEIRKAMQAAFSYINSKFGGIGGHPIKVEYCSAVATPESSSRCANQLLDKRPMLIMAGADTTSSASVPIIAGAKVPYVTSFPTSTQELTCATCFTFNGGTTDIPKAVLRDLKRRKIYEASVMYADLPAAKLPADDFHKQAKAQGVKTIEVPQPALNPDATAALVAAAKWGPDAIVVLTGSAQCSSVMKNANALGIRARLYFASGCGDPRTLSNGGSGADGSFFSTNFDSFDEVNRPEVALYRQKSKQYAPDNPIAFYPQSGFSGVMTMYNVLKGLKDNQLTSQGVLAALRSARNVPIFMGVNGAKLSCDGKQAAGLPAVCSTASDIVQYRGGKFVNLS